MRTEARIKCSIWEDQDYLKLPVEAKLLYQFLLEQDDLNLCGVIPLRETRWDGPLGINALLSFLEILEKARFVVIDCDQGELWVRTFMRHDGVLKSPNIIKGARNALGSVHSAKIRAALAAEYPELAQDWDLDTPSDTPSETLPETLPERVLSRMRARRTEDGGRRTEGGRNASVCGDVTLRGRARSDPSADDEPEATAPSVAPLPAPKPQPAQHVSAGDGVGSSATTCPKCHTTTIRQQRRKADGAPFVSCPDRGCNWTEDGTLADYLNRPRLRQRESLPEPPIPTRPIPLVAFSPELQGRLDALAAHMAMPS